MGGIFRSCPLTSQKLPLCGNHQTQRILGQLLRSLLQNPRNFSEVAPEVYDSGDRNGQALKQASQKAAVDGAHLAQHDALQIQHSPGTSIDLIIAKV